MRMNMAKEPTNVAQYPTNLVKEHVGQPKSMDESQNELPLLYQPLKL